MIIFKFVWNGKIENKFWISKRVIRLRGGFFKVGIEEFIVEGREGEKNKWRGCWRGKVLGKGKGWFKI